jgi:ABC-type iron transport system FetAB permease component
VGDAINVMLSAAAFNFKRMMRKWKSSFLQFFYRFFISPFFSFCNPNFFYQKEKWVFKG